MYSEVARSGQKWPEVARSGLSRNYEVESTASRKRPQKPRRGILTLERPWASADVFQML